MAAVCDLTFEKRQKLDGLKAKLLEARRLASDALQTVAVVPDTAVGDPELTRDLLVRMLKVQEERRFASEMIARFEARAALGGEWIDVVADLQREVAIDCGFVSAEGISKAVHQMRVAHISDPSLAQYSVYARHNLAEDGALRDGQAWPDVRLFALDGSNSPLSVWCGKLTVICAGSWT